MSALKMVQGQDPKDNSVTHWWVSILYKNSLLLLLLLFIIKLLRTVYPTTPELDRFIFTSGKDFLTEITSIDHTKRYASWLM